MTGTEIATSEPAAPARDPRERLLEIAGETFAERGYDATTIKEITERAGINVASVNYYFRDKFSLYLEVLRASMACRNVIDAGAPGLSPEERLTNYLLSFVGGFVAEGRPGWYRRIMIWELAKPTAALPRIVEDLIRPNYEFLRQLVSEVAGPGRSAESVRLLTHSVLAQCVHWKVNKPILAHLSPDLQLEPPHLERIARHIAAFSIAGIKAYAKAAEALP